MNMRDMLDVIKQRYIVVVAFVLLAAIGAGVAASGRSVTYTAALDMARRSTPPAPTAIPVPIVSLPERGEIDPRLVRNAAVAERTAAALGGDTTADEILKAVGVTSGLDGPVTIVVKSSDADEAKAIAETFAREYVAWTAEKRSDAFLAAAEELEAELDAEQKAFGADRPIKTTADLIAAQNLMTKVGLAATLRTYASYDNGAAEILGGALVTESDGASLVSYVLFGAVLGFVFGSGAAFALDALDDTVRSERTLERAIPDTSAAGLGGLFVPGTGSTPTAADERFRTLATTLAGQSVGEPGRGDGAVLVTAVDDSAPVGEVARGLARAWSATGESAVFVDADMHRSVGAAESGPSFAGLLRGDRLAETGDPAIASGGPVADPGALLRAPAIEEALAQLSWGYSRAVLAAPAMGAVSDTVLLAPHVGTIAVVVVLGRTRGEQLREHWDALARVTNARCFIVTVAPERETAADKRS